MKKMITLFVMMVVLASGITFAGTLTLDERYRTGNAIEQDGSFYSILSEETIVVQPEGQPQYEYRRFVVENVSALNRLRSRELLVPQETPTPADLARAEAAVEARKQEHAQAGQDLDAERSTSSALTGQQQALAATVGGQEQQRSQSVALPAIWFQIALIVLILLAVGAAIIKGSVLMGSRAQPIHIKRADSVAQPQNAAIQGNTESQDDSPSSP